MLDAPNRIDISKTVERPRPAAWKGQLPDTRTVPVLPLIDGEPRRAGWCSYVERFGGAPDTEVICGGVNQKRPSAAAVWRQANLLHFGFQESPDELNDTGRALLENAIHYILRFGHERPIVNAPSVFVTRQSIPQRATLLSRIRRPSFKTSWITRYLDAKEQAAFAAAGREKYAERFERLMGRMGLSGTGTLQVDPDLMALDASNDDLAMIEGAAAWLRSEQTRDAGRRLLSRYVPCGPDPAATADVWTSWLREHEDYLFFSESGQYRWYVDPIAKARGVPQSELRGPKRAQ